VRNELPAELDPERVTALYDPREQQPWDLSPLRMVRRTLDTGDYAVSGAEWACRIERKTLTDFVGCCGSERDRFTRELERLLAYPTRIVVIEASLAELHAGEWRNHISVASVIGSIASWSAMGVNIMFAGDREAAQDMARRILFMVAKRQYIGARKLVGELVPKGLPARGSYPAETLAAFDPSAEAVA
jgi:ERCC4-type nuclease